MDDPILEVRDLHTHFLTREGVGRAVDGVSFSVQRGETLGLVGESGSGKSMTALSILRLNPRPASKIVSGEVIFRGTDLLKLSEREMTSYRGRHIAMVLQDPQTALNPVLTIGNQLGESLRLHRGLRGPGLRERSVELMRLLRVPDPAARLSSYPHQFSGGMRQRAVGAIALAGEPELLIADEPTTALDVTTQAAYLELLKSIQKQTGLAIVFITHDINVVSRLCDRVVVMYAGKTAESTHTEALLARPAHPYSKALMASVPRVTERRDRLVSIEGQPPSMYADLPGCPFAPRCPEVLDRCRREFPPAIAIAPGHIAYCWARARHEHTR